MCGPDRTRGRVVAPDDLTARQLVGINSYHHHTGAYATPFCKWKPRSYDSFAVCGESDRLNTINKLPQHPHQDHDQFRHPRMVIFFSTCVYDCCSPVLGRELCYCNCRWTFSCGGTTDDAVMLFYLSRPPTMYRTSLLFFLPSDNVQRLY